MCQWLGPRPKGRCHGCLKQKQVDNIIDRSNDVLNFTVLLEGVGTLYAALDATCEEESVGAGVVELVATSVIKASLKRQGVARMTP